MNKKNKNKSDYISLVDKLLNSLGVSEKELKKESSNEVLIPKMSLIGILESMRHVVESLKNSILASPGKLNTSLIRLYLTAIGSSATYALSILGQYEQAMGIGEQEEEQLSEPSMDAMVEQTSQDVESVEEDLEELDKDLEDILNEYTVVNRKDKKSQN